MNVGKEREQDKLMAYRFFFYLCGDRNKASSRVRGYWIAEELEERGMRCSLEPRHTKRALASFVFKIFFYEVVVFQKTYSRWHVLLERLARLLGKKTILDLDDAPSRNNSPVTLRNVEKMMQNVTAVTVGSKALKEYAEQYSENVHLIPSSIQLKYYTPKDRFNNESFIAHSKSQAIVSDGNGCDNNKNAGSSDLSVSKSSDVVTIGWIGNGRHYKRDLIKILKQPLTEVAKMYPISFKLIGACGEQELYNAFSNIQGLKIDFIDQIEWSDPTAVAEALQDIDIGLYPLLANEFNQYKCGFKALEYMAMAIPVISSDVAENREIVSHGENGLFANSSLEWADAIRVLIRDNISRTSMGKIGRALVEKRYSIQAAADRMMQLVGGEKVNDFD